MATQTVGRDLRFIVTLGLLQCIMLALHMAEGYSPLSSGLVNLLKKNLRDVLKTCMMCDKSARLGSGMLEKLRYSEYTEYAEGPECDEIRAISVCQALLGI